MKPCRNLFLFVVFTIIIGSLSVLNAEQIKDVKSVTPSDAYAMWLENPGKVKVIDCRTQEEYEFVGHAFMAYNIPCFFWTGKWDSEKKMFIMESNPDFGARVKEKFALDDTILLMCRSGSRSLKGVKRLVKAGFTNVYTIAHGFEGGKVTEHDSNFKGQRVKNGWKNSGQPWTYKLSSKLIYIR
ncbi:MAG: sulfurtransferase [Deltaproteobacteria bacterium]|nr:sulfurtransferase [Deltaproteobacteria bacterium]